VERNGRGDATRSRSTGNESISTTRQPLADTPELQALLERFAPALTGLGTALDPGQTDRLVRLADLIARWGSRINLSGHRTAAEIFERLILDALTVGALIEDVVGRWPDRVVDLGSGAGIPGLPLAIAHPGSQFELVEARERRHHFQRAACRELGIANAAPRLGRIEQLEPSVVSVVIAQAVGPIGDVAALAERWIAPGGWLFVPSGVSAPRFDPGQGWIQHGTRPYAAPGASAERTVWFGQRDATGR